MVAHNETLSQPGGAEENHETLKQCNWSLNPVSVMRSKSAIRLISKFVLQDMML